MSGSTHTLDALRDVEEPLNDLEGWAGLVIDLGASGNQIDPSGVGLVGGAMLQAVKRVQVAFDAAWLAAGGKQIAGGRT